MWCQISGLSVATDPAVHGSTQVRDTSDIQRAQNDLVHYQAAHEHGTVTLGEHINPVNHSSIQKELCSAIYPTYQPWEFSVLIILLNL